MPDQPDASRALSLDDFLTRYDTRKTSREGVWMTLHDAETGDEIVVENEALGPGPIELKVIGIDNPLRQESLEEMGERLQRMASLSKARKVSVEERWRVQAETTAKWVLEWRRVPYDLTEENAAKFFGMFLGFRAEVDAFTGLRANFLQKIAPPSSAPPSGG